MAELFVPGIGAIRYHEVARSQEESCINGQPRATRTFDVVEWQHRWPFIREMVGYPSLAPLVAVPVDPVDYGLFRKTPDPYPVANVKGNWFMFATDVVEMMGYSPRGWNVDYRYGLYRHARIKLGYSVRTYPILKDDEMSQHGLGYPDESTLRRYVTRVVQPAAERLQLSRGAYVWGSTVQTPEAGMNGRPSIIDYPLSRTFRYLDYVYTWHEVPGLPREVGSLIDGVNQFLFDHRCPETMHFIAAEIFIRRLPAGDRVYDLSYRMRFQAQTHNKVLRYRFNDPQGLLYSDPIYDTPVTGANLDKKLFESVDFRKLFRTPLVPVL